jgi:MFS family permease
VCGLFVAAAGAFSVTMVRESWHAFLAAGLVGLGMAVVTPAQDALLATVVTPRQRPAVFAVRNATLNAGYGIGGVGAALVADLASPSSFVALYVVDGLTFLAFIPVLVLMLPVERPSNDALPPSEVSTPPVRTGYREVLRDRTFLLVWVLIAVLVGIGFAQAQAAFPAYATGTGRVSAAVIGIALAANTFTIVALQLPVLRLLEHHRRTTGIALACLCWALAWALTAAVGTWGEGTTLLLGFPAAMMVFAVGETLLAPSQASLVNDLAPDHLRGRYNGLYTLAWTTGLAVGPAVAGATLDGGHGTALFLGLALACVVTGLAALRLGRHLPASVDVVAWDRGSA